MGEGEKKKKGVCRVVDVVLLGGGSLAIALYRAEMVFSQFFFSPYTPALFHYTFRR